MGMGSELEVDELDDDQAAVIAQRLAEAAEETGVAVTPAVRAELRARLARASRSQLPEPKTER